MVVDKAAVPIGDEVLYRFSVRPFICLFIRPHLWAIQPDLRPSQPVSQASVLAGWPRGGDGWTDGWINEWKISPFYRTLFPIGAAALLAPMKTAKLTDQ